MEDKVIVDLHIHSRYSRATSKDITVQNLIKWGKIKGIDLLGTGDFTHDMWIKEVRKELIDDGSGILKSKEGMNFVLSGEISLMYSQDGKGRRVHLVVLAPDFNVLSKIHSFLDALGRRDYDGRPIFNISCWEFIKKLKEISDEIEIIPAHIWTPWFGVLGSKSGFDSLEQAFKEQVDKIYAIETGLSSDPPMNWRFSDVAKKTILSFSDAHSFWPWRLGREATIFNKVNTYKDLINQIRKNKIYATIEVNPAYGKYHWDGHRFCNFSCSPEESKKLNNICPVCKKPLTIGVEHRVDDIADMPKTYHPENAKPFYELLPLHELISLAYSTPISSTKSWKIYNRFIEKYGNEFKVLLEVEKEEMFKDGFDEKLIKLIIDNRIANLKIKPGFDGVYGKVIFKEEQKKLF